MAHIKHLTEDRSLKLSTIRAILESASKGELPDATEKLDGVNIMYTCSSKYEVRFARSESDIRSGGMSKDVLAAKFTSRGIVQETFAKGAAAIAHAVRSMSSLQLIQAFEGNRLWFSAEIVYTKNPNVVLYANDCVVFHGRPVLRLYGDRVIPGWGPPWQTDHFTTIEKAIPFMDEDVRPLGWRVHGPQRLIYGSVSTHEALQNVAQTLAVLGKPDETLQDCLEKFARCELEQLGVRGQTLDDAVKRLTKSEEAPSLATLRSKLPTRALAMLRESDEWIFQRLRGLDLAIARFSNVLLSDTRSALVADHDAEVRRIRERLARSVKLVSESRNPAALAILERQMEKLETVDNVSTPVEGVVFSWEDKLYKLTGSFAPANAIMGLCKYGRGKAIPPFEPT